MTSPILVPGVPNAPAPLLLAPIDVDYSSIQADFYADLTLQGSWSELLPAGTGSALVRWVSSATAFMQGGTARALQENYPDTARTPGGVLRAQRLFQGGGIIRRRPGSLTVTLSRTDLQATTMGIAANSQWIVGGAYFYNLDVIVVPQSGQATATLYQGVITSVPLVSDGSPFQRFVIGSPNQWDVGQDVLVATDSTGFVWPSTDDGLWQTDEDGAVVFRASTLPDGTVECRFGDGTYGAIPPAGSLVFTYASVNSALASAAGPPAGSKATPTSTAYTVTGTTTSTPPANQDQPPPEFYKAVGPGLASNRGRAVARADYRALAMKYDGVIDAAFRFQRETNPSDLRFMNIAETTLLTTTPWSESQWLAFVRYMEEDVGISNLYLSRVDPTPVPIPIDLNVGASSLADDASLTSLIESVLATFFTPRAGSLGLVVYPSDLILAIVENATYQQAPNEAGSLVDYVYPILPSGPVQLPITSYPTQGTTSVSVVPTARGSANITIGRPVLST